jgi:hypothetical protein
MIEGFATERIIFQATDGVIPTALKIDLCPLACGD